jgi:hypothetical protein
MAAYEIAEWRKISFLNEGELMCLFVVATIIIKSKLPKAIVPGLIATRQMPTYLPV